MVQLPLFWRNGMLSQGDALRGDVFLVYLTKDILVRNGTELNRHHGQRDWRAKFAEIFPDGRVPPGRILEVAKAVNHGYRGERTAHDMVVQLAAAFGVATEELEQYYKHCRAVQRDLSHLAEEELDYLDLFGDHRREKICTQAGTATCTMACVADCLRLHPLLMEASWNTSHASRDAETLFGAAAPDVVRFNEMLDSDRRRLICSLVRSCDLFRARLHMVCSPRFVYPRHASIGEQWICLLSSFLFVGGGVLSLLSLLSLALLRVSMLYQL